MGDETTPDVFKTHLHRGVRYPNIILDSSIDAMASFHVRPDDIWVATYPKSGTHWMLEIAGLILADGHPDRIDRSLFGASVCMIDIPQGLPATKAEEAEMPLLKIPFLDHVERAPSPRLIWTHLSHGLLPPNLTKTAKVLYLARNPKDVLNSMYSFYSKTPIMKDVPFGAMLQNFTQEDMIWGPWFTHVKSFWDNREDENLFFCFYEDLIKDLPSWVKKLAIHLGRPLSDEAAQRVVTNSTFSGMKQTYDHATDMSAGTGKAASFVTSAAFGKVGQKNRSEAPFLNKGTVGQWKDRFTVEQNEAFDDWCLHKKAETDFPIFTFE